MRILWIPHAGWHIPQRAHLFCRALAERHEIHVTDWVADFTALRDFASRRYLENFLYRHRRDGKITVHGIPRISPALYSAALRRLNTAIFSRTVQRIIEQHRIDVVVGSFVVPPPRAPRLVFDLFDDNPAYWREYGNVPAVASEIAESENAWVLGCDHVMVVSSVLRDKLAHDYGSEILENVTIIPNGVDLKRYRATRGEAVRHSLGLNGCRIVGFISSLGEFSGVIRYMEAARLLDEPDLAHLVVGSGPLLSKAKSAAESWGLSNVFFTGQVDFSDVAGYFAALDVGVIPFDLSDFTHSACPIKLIEYVACGKPVVSTPLKEVKRMGFAGVIFAEPDPQSFADGISRALDAPKGRVVDLSLYDQRKLVEKCENVLLGRQ